MSSMVEVSVARLGLDGSTNSYVVILKEKEGDRLLPIWIGQAEAESILLEMNGVKKERPLTHDLCRSLVVGMGGELRRVQITRVLKGTYYAEMHIVRAENVYTVDSRPSDAIAVALRFPAPIFADDSLLAEAAAEEADEPTFPTTSPVQSTEEMNAEELKQYLSGLRPEDFGKFHL
jgi:bifunctional DNase/RNase